jgi:hypothetical protein
MAKNVIINGSSYSEVPFVQIPLSGGGGNAIFYETSDATAAAANILTGYSAYGASGKLTGTATAPVVSQDASTKVLTIS